MAALVCAPLPPLPPPPFPWGFVALYVQQLADAKAMSMSMARQLTDGMHSGLTLKMTVVPSIQGAYYVTRTCQFPEGYDSVDTMDERDLSDYLRAVYIPQMLRCIARAPHDPHRTLQLEFCNSIWHDDGYVRTTDSVYIATDSATSDDGVPYTFTLQSVTHYTNNVL